MTAPESKPVLMLPAALWWASKGVPVFPLHSPMLTPMLEWACSCESDCASPAKHPRTPRGFHDATTDTAVIGAWWERWPEANIGLRTGVTFDLLDIDGPAGFAVLEQMTTELGAEPGALCVVESGRADGGRHFYMAPPGLGTLQQGRTSPVGVDAKSDGGYVVAPPSQHISGYRYTMTKPYGTATPGASWESLHGWLSAHAPKREVEQVTAGHEVTVDVEREPSRQARLQAWCAGSLRGRSERLAAMEPDTGRNNALNACAYVLLRYAEAGLLEHEVVLETLREAASACGLPRIGVEKTLRSAAGAARQQGGLEPDLEDDQMADVEAPPPVLEAEVDGVSWEPPDSLEISLPEFPTWTLGPMEKAVVELAAYRQVPVDMVAMMALGTLAATVRNRVQVRISQDWAEPLNLFVCAVLPAGEAKSPTLSVVASPLHELEKELQEAARPHLAKLVHERKMAEGRLARLEKLAIGAIDEDRAVHENAAFEAARALEEMPRPVVPRLLAGDMTAEALVRLLAEQGGVMASLSAEGGLLDTFAGGRYSAGMANLDALLQAHDGREAIKVDRKTGDPIRVENPCLTLLLAVQPQVLHALGESAAAIGRGLTARFLWTIPATKVGTRVYDLSHGQNQSIGYFGHVVRGVDRLCGAVDGSRLLAFLSMPLYRADLKVSSLSLSRYQEYLNKLEPRRHPANGDLAAIGDWSRKIDGQVARLAGLLELIYLAGDGQYGQYTGAVHAAEVELPRMEAACALMDYLIEHAVAAHRMLRGEGMVVDKHAQQLIGWARTHGLATFTVREAHRALRGRLDFREVESVKHACQVLEAHGWLCKVATGEESTPGRRRELYAVNPLEP